MKRILQEIATVGRRLAAMETKVTDLAMNSIRTDIAGFQDRVSDLDRCLTDAEGRLSNMPDRDQKLQFLQNKLMYLEDRSRRDNVSFFWILEQMESMDVRAFLKDFLPELIGLVFSHTLEFQRTHRIGPLHRAISGKSRSIIACFHRHKQVRQLLTAACSQCLYDH
ncbi:hypothetical protein NDU88_005444 [Pleurodeles waltl]|uniref:Uncharacterized protein n=1 Tax=Pleurodeles waltl TaxID=8319 RepID=A0AAV7UK57_PLEWA|nr:hypothetical protein NDU88_005444 [Pleurodeles waltl]